MVLYKQSAHELKRQFVSGSLSAEKITSYFLDRIEKIDPQIGSLLHVFREKSQKIAHELDQRRSQGKPLGKLAGVPIIIKDNIHIKGEKTTCGSKFLQNFIAPFDAFVVEKLKQEDAIILGKANLDEFAMGSSNEKSAYKKAHNPWNLDYTPGGSSGGSAASVAGMLAPLSLGSDTGGSIRQPAAFSGIYGHRPTYGRVSRYGLVAFASSLDQIGPFARNIDDLALIHSVISGHCRRDSTSLNLETDHASIETLTSLKGTTFGICPDLLEKVSHDVKKVYEEALYVFKDLGVTTKEISLPMSEYSIPIYYILASAEASTNLARFDGIRYTTRSPKAKTLEEVYELSRKEGFGAEVKQRIFLGTYVLSAGHKEAFFHQAQKARRLVLEERVRVFKTCDAIFMPTTPVPAFKLGAITDPIHMYLQDMFTIGQALAGIPALNFPAGFSHEGLPIGLQLETMHLKDHRLFSWAKAFAMKTSHLSFIPPLFDKELT